MICILKFKPVFVPSPAYSGPGGEHPSAGTIAGWIIATDMHDARRQAQAGGEMELASALYGQEWLGPGKHQVTPEHVALVS